MAKLQLSTGVKTYEIEDENGKLLGAISIYPNDFNIAKRAKEVQEKITTHINEAERIANQSGNDAVEQITELDNKIKEQLDYLFKTNVSCMFNGLHCLNINPDNGKYFIENFMDMMMPVIEKEMRKAAEKNQQQVSKYTKQVIDE